MTIIQAQPLNIPTASELTKALDFLFEAHMLVTDAKLLFLNTGDFAAAARLKEIQGRLADERLIAAQSASVSPIDCGVTARLMCMAVTRRGHAGVKSALFMYTRFPAQRIS